MLLWHRGTVRVLQDRFDRRLLDVRHDLVVEMVRLRLERLGHTVRLLLDVVDRRDPVRLDRHVIARVRHRGRRHPLRRVPVQRLRLERFRRHRSGRLDLGALARQRTVAVVM